MNKTDQIYTLIFIHLALVMIILFVLPLPFNVFAAIALFGPITVLFMALHKRIDVKDKWR